jgi:hypothetical protein
MRDHADVSAWLRRYLDGEDGPVSSPDGPTSAPSVGPTHFFRVRRPSTSQREPDTNFPRWLGGNEVSGG